MNIALKYILDRIQQNFSKQPKVIPAGAAGVTATANAAGGYAKGAYVELAAASVITTKYKPTALVIDNISAADEYEVELASGGAGSETTIGTFKFGAEGRIQIPSIAAVDANTRLAARIGCNDAVARTANISVEYIDGLL